MNRKEALLEAAHNLARITEKYVIGVKGVGPSSVKRALAEFQSLYDADIQPLIKVQAGMRKVEDMSNGTEGQIYVLTAFDEVLRGSQTLGYATDSVTASAFESEFRADPNNEHVSLRAQSVMPIKLA